MDDVQFFYKTEISKAVLKTVQKQSTVGVL